MTHNELLFRRHFIMGPRFVEKFDTWNKIHWSQGYCLTVHPDLKVVDKRLGNRRLLCLGFMLDPYEPELTVGQILSNLFNALHKLSDFVYLTSKLGGRWLLLVDTGDENRLYPDAIGLRQVCYTRVESDG